MSKKSKRMLLCLMLGSTVAIAASCSDEKKNEAEHIIDNIEKPVEENPVIGTLTASEQKKKLDAAGQAFLDQINVADFKYFSSLADYIDQDMNDYDDDAITKWADDLLEQMSVKGGTTEEKNENYYWIETFHYTNYTQLIVFSNFVGHFKAENKKWNYTKANDLQFSLKDQEGQQVTLTITTSGSYKDVHIGEDEDWQDYEYTWNGNISYYDEYINVYDRTVRVPSKITAILKQGSTVKAQLEVNIDLSGMKDVDYNLATDAYSANSTLTIGEYSFKNTKTAYNGKSDAAITATLWRGSQSLVAFSVSADGNYSQEVVKKVNIGVDVMGAVQIKGAINNGNDFIDYMNNAEKNDENESKFKSNIALANDLLNLGVYYDGKSERQATVLLECFNERDRWSNYWYCEPVFCFGEDSSYTTFGVFFDSGFDKLISKYEKILNDFEKLF